MSNLIDQYQRFVMAKGAIKAEVKENNLVILEKIEPFSASIWENNRKVKKTLAFTITYIWFSETGVKGSDISYWTREEGQKMIQTSILENIDLF